MTRAVRYLAARTLDTAPVTSPPPGPGEVEVAPAYVGICGTDLHIFHGDMDARVHAPAVLGHEMSGRVVRVGPDTEGWRPGDAVTVMPLRWDTYRTPSEAWPIVRQLISHCLLTGLPIAWIAARTQSANRPSYI